MKKTIFGRLSRQLLQQILAIYFIITIVITAVQLIAEYYDTLDMINNELVIIEKIFTPALRGALWEFNRPQLEAIQRGISDFPSVSFITIRDPYGNVNRIPKDKEYANILLSHRFDIKYAFAGKEKFLANIQLDATHDVVFKRLALRYKLLLGGALLKSFFLSLLFIWVFRRSLGRPLEQLTQSVQAINLASLKDSHIDLLQKNNNELRDLENAFNAMIATLDSERRQHEEELLAINRGLEALVKERTLELEKLIRTDALTSLSNRRYFMEIGNNEILRAKRNGHPLSLMMIDLDFFKKINDKWGHAGGDAVLRDFSETARSVVRGNDSLARLGGEEFAILLPETDIPGAAALADRLLRAVRSRGASYQGQPIDYTASIGLTALRHAVDTYDSFLGRADAGLYEAKKNGRNRLEKII